MELEEKNGEFWGISPFTFPPENTPSFSVNPKEQAFYDFSSGIGGNVYTFERLYKKCSGWDAVETLLKYAGVEDGSQFVKKERLPAVLSCEKFRKPPERRKNSEKKVLSPDIMLLYERDEDKMRIWRDEGISQESMDRFHVRYDPVANRLVYPIYNAAGEIVNIGGRTLDQDFKTKGIRKYNYYYKWGTITVVFGLYDHLAEIQKKKEIILFEGCKSVLLADTWGIRNTGALLTSHLSEYQMRLIASLGVHVVFMLDKEIDIRKDRNIQKLKNYSNVEYYVDTGGFLQEKDAPVDRGKEVFLHLYEARRRFR